MVSNTLRIGFVFDQIGAKEAAMKYFYEHIDFCEESIRKNSGYARWYGLAYYDLAAIYAHIGKEDLAYEYLNRFRQNEFFAAWLVDLLQRDVMFETLRNKQAFIKIEQEIINKGQQKMQALAGELDQK